MDIEAEVKLVKRYQAGVKMGVKVEIKVKVNASVKVSNSIFDLKKYKLNCLFKYSNSMAESGNIVITEPT